VAASKEYDLSGPNGAVVFRNLPEGLKVRLTNGALGEITGNPHDGAYLLVRILENSADPSKVGNDELVFFNDVKEVE
jgi:hypothetical protein